MKTLLILTFILACFSSNHVLATTHNTTDWVELSEIRGWENVIDVYFTNNQVHRCGSSHSTRFLLAVDKEHLVSILLLAYAAQKKVMLRYTCENNGANPMIDGIRLKH